MRRLAEGIVWMVPIWLAAASAARAAPTVRPSVLDSVPHDSTAFTQGLLVHAGKLYESTGLEGASTVREVDLDTGEVLRSMPLPSNLFGEGLALVEDRFIQLTWQDQIALIWDATTLERQDYDYVYTTEGWGLCFDGTRLVMSDGTPTLYFRDPTDFDVIGQVEVTLDGQPLDDLNELECVGDVVWANVWQSDDIVRIDTATGEIDLVVDASGLLSSAEAAEADVLNGIAWDPVRELFWITGKFWPWTFLVELEPSDGETTGTESSGTGTEDSASEGGDDSTSSGSEGSSSSTGTSGTTTSGTSGDESTSTDETTAAETSDTSDGADESSGTEGDDTGPDPGGCDCRSGSVPAIGWSMAPLLVRRRRRSTVSP